MPDGVLVVRESQVLGDAAKGAGAGFMYGALGFAGLLCSAGPYGCVYGIIGAPFVGGAGMVVGSVYGAATSDPAETPHPLSDLPSEAPTTLESASHQQNLEEMLASTMVAAAVERTHHTLQLLPESWEGSDIPNPWRTVTMFTPEPRGESDFQGLLATGQTHGVLFLTFSQLGFTHQGAFDADDADPKLALVLRAKPSLYFLVGDRVRKASFKEQAYEGARHRLSELTQDKGRLLSEDLRNGIEVISDRFVTDLFHVGEPTSEEYIDEPTSAEYIHRGNSPLERKRRQAYGREFSNSNYARGWQLLCNAADKDDGYAQADVAFRYAHGLQPVERDLIRAYMWYTLAVERGNTHIMVKRAALAKQMTDEEIMRATRLAEQWRPRRQLLLQRQTRRGPGSAPSSGARCWTPLRRSAQIAGNDAPGGAYPSN